MQISQQVIEKMKRLEKLDRPLIIGIDGLSGSGKTTITKKVNEELKNEGYQVVVIHMDDLIVERAKRYNTGYPEWVEYYKLQWNVQYIKENLFEAVHQKSNQVYLKFYEMKTDQSCSQEISLERCTFILIEGVFLQRKEWRGFFDYIMYLDCPKKVRNQRVLERDAYIGDRHERLAKYERRYWMSEAYYIKEEDPLKNADIIFRDL